MPRALKKASGTDTPKSSAEPENEIATSKDEKPKLSNDDFRKMFQ